MAVKNSIPITTHSFPVTTHLILYVSDFHLEKCGTLGHKRELTYLYACWIMHMKCCQQISKFKAKELRWPEKLLIWGRSGTQYVAMVTELSSSYCGAHLVESYYKESNISDSNWLRYLFSSYFYRFWLSVCHVITWLICIF